MARKITLGKGSVYIKKLNNIGGIKMGSVFKNISKSTIINESEVKECLNKISLENDDSFANALLEIAKQVEASKDPEAGALFNSFTNELNKESPSKSVLMAIWDGIIRQLPHISSMVSVVEKITKLF